MQTLVGAERFNQYLHTKWAKESNGERVCRLLEEENPRIEEYKNSGYIEIEYEERVACSEENSMAERCIRGTIRCQTILSIVSVISKSVTIT